MGAALGQEAVLECGPRSADCGLLGGAVVPIPHSEFRTPHSEEHEVFTEQPDGPNGIRIEVGYRGDWLPVAAE
jgi:hypothetical protein